MTALTAASMIFPLTSCVLSYNASVYDHADSYSAGDFETTTAITALDIDWSAGNVDVSYHDKDTVTVTETCNVSRYTHGSTAAPSISATASRAQTSVLITPRKSSKSSFRRIPS